jgi:diaminohydroxyphosphoribosylaminopyrimidine deaminase / 5-amino-6-(5-phosphoribosylamino)uracil reductase
VVAVMDQAPVERITRLEARGVTVLCCKSREGRVDLGDLCTRLHAMEVMSVLLEGGSELNGAFVEAGLVDRVAIFIAPILVGGAGAPTAVGGRGLALSEGIRLSSLELRPVGRDWLIEADVERPAA